jgi:endonuclease-3
MNWPSSPLGTLFAKLEKLYGKPTPTPFENPFEMVLWEIVGYLADDVRRASAFEMLRNAVGLTPEKILAAPLTRLTHITHAGGSIAYDERAQRLQDAARLAVRDFDGDLKKLLNMPAARAKKLLTEFPMIGEPGAEKILMYFGVLPVLALESNGVRVLARYGFGQERKSYAMTYKSIREATAGQLPEDAALLTAAFLLSKRHGQERCHRVGPECRACPLSTACRSANIVG